MFVWFFRPPGVSRGRGRGRGMVYMFLIKITKKINVIYMRSV